MNDNSLFSETVQDIKSLSRTIRIATNPDHWDLKALYINAAKKGYDSPELFRFMIHEDSGDIYVWCGGLGLHRAVVKTLGFRNTDFSAFGEFIVNRKDPRQLEEVSWIAKDIFTQDYNSKSMYEFNKIAKSLLWKRSPGFIGPRDS